MKLCILLLFCLLRATRGQMMGGLEAEEGAFPFAVQIHSPRCRRSRCMCGGSVIGGNRFGNRWVITAAHCVWDLVTRRNYEVKVVAGDIWRVPDYWGLRPNRVEMIPEWILRHPNYEASPHDYDLGLLFFKQRITVNDRIRAIGLPAMRGHGDRELPSPGDQCIVMGWGNTRLNPIKEIISFDPPLKLKVGYLRVRDVTYHHIIFHLDRNGVYPLHGDSGSPLLCKDSDGSWKQFGLYRGANLTHDFGYFMRLESFRGWIDTTQFNIEKLFFWGLQD